MERLNNYYRILTIIAIFTLAWSINSSRGLAAPGAAPALAPLGTAFTYEGRMPASLSGVYDFRFRLFDAPTSGALVFATIASAGDILVSDGEYIATVNFGSATASAFTGEARYLEVQYRLASAEPGTPYTLLSGKRPPLLPVPYAMSLRAGATISGSTSTGAASLTASNIGTGVGLWGKSVANAAVYGESTNSTGILGQGAVAGVRGRATRDGVGVRGDAVSNAGVYGESTNSTGVLGQGAVVGVRGRATGGGIGVRGDATSNAGVYGQSTNSTGVLGEGGFIGVRGRSTSGTGVYGESSNGYAGFFNGKTATKVLEIQGGADLAERFDVQGDLTVAPGTLMVIDENNPGKLRISNQPYDTKVAGIVSGAGNVQPGLTLQQTGVLDGKNVVAIAGRVYVQADATSVPIKPGDLLTTSSLSGTAMKATDGDRAYGAVIGKAMTGLETGTGLVLVLVNLQ